MQDFADMAEAHEWTLRRLREMTGRLTEQAYLRATEAVGHEEDEAAARWMLVFDRVARGLRLSIALEAKHFRERRWDADEIQREASGQRHAPRWRRPSEPSERDRERDDDGLPAEAPLSQRIARLKTIIEGAGIPEPPSVPHSIEILADRARADRRTRRTPLAPDQTWDVLTSDDQAYPDHTAPDEVPFRGPPWRGSG